MLSLKQIRLLSTIFIISFIVVISLMALDLLSGMALTNLFDPPKNGESLIDKRNQTIMNLGHSMAIAMFFYPLIAWLLARKGKVSFAFGVILGLFSFILAVIGKFNVGVIFFPLFMVLILIHFFKAGASLKLVLLGTIGAIIFAPLIFFVLNAVPSDFAQKLPPSWEHRFVMWQYVSSEISNAILFGHGFDSVRTIEASFVNQLNYHMDIVSLHPHNFGLQIWYETGLVGAVLASLAILSIGKNVMKNALNKPETVLPSSSLLLGLMLVGVVSYGVWQEWLWATAIMISALYSAFLRKIPETDF